MPVTWQEIKVGDRVSYEDMANPRRSGTVREIAQSAWGTEFHVEWDEADRVTFDDLPVVGTISDLRQYGWSLAASAGNAEREAVSGLLRQIKERAFTDPDTTSDEKAMGKLVAEFFEWGTTPVYEACIAALTDANLHGAAAELDERRRGR